MCLLPTTKSRRKLLKDLPTAPRVSVSVVSWALDRAEVLGFHKNLWEAEAKSYQAVLNLIRPCKSYLVPLLI